MVSGINRIHLRNSNLIQKVERRLTDVPITTKKKSKKSLLMSKEDLRPIFAKG